MPPPSCAQLVPQAGSYVSESNYFNANWPQRLLGRALRAAPGDQGRYDPEGLFIVHHGVGSEDWSADGFSRA